MEYYLFNQKGKGDKNHADDSVILRLFMKRARILLADDHTLTLEGLRAVLEPPHEIIAAVRDGRALVEAAPRLRPDLIVVDITMPLLNGIDAANQIRKGWPEAKLLFVTMHVSPAYLEAALNAGGSGYVVKSSAREELIEAVASVLKGKTYIAPELTWHAPERFHDAGTAAASLRLSGREREVLQLVAEGKSAKEIAFVLKISVKTVAFHRYNIKNKLGLRTTAHMTRHAIEQGLV